MSSMRIPAAYGASTYMHKVCNMCGSCLPFSKASYATSRASLCWGSIDLASIAVIEKKGASNSEMSPVMKWLLFVVQVPAWSKSGWKKASALNLSLGTRVLVLLQLASRSQYFSGSEAVPEKRQPMPTTAMGMSGTPPSRAAKGGIAELAMFEEDRSLHLCSQHGQHPRAQAGRY